MTIIVVSDAGLIASKLLKDQVPDSESFEGTAALEDEQMSLKEIAERFEIRIGTVIRRSMVDVSVIARVIDSLELRRDGIIGLPANAAVVAYDELCYAFATTLSREVEGFDHPGFLRATLGIRGGW